jgi:outer membrane protein assembly factor BamB
VNSFTTTPTTLKIKGRITTLANPNSMVYDRSSGRLFVGHKPSKSITVIRASSGEIEKVIPLGGVPEFPVTDGAGSIFVNINDQSEIVRIDAKSMTIKSRWPLKPCQSPSGLAFDEQKNRLFSACDNKLMAVMDAGTGKLISTLPIGDGPDAATFDPETRLAFSSNGDGTLTVIAEHGDGYAVVQNLRTEVGARTMTLDIKNHSIYLPTAKLGPPPAPTAENPNPPKHPTAIAGTFHLIVATPIASR